LIENKVTADNFKIVPIEDIHPDPSNTNTHPDDQIAMLIEQFKIQGFRDPLIVDKGDGLLVCGEGRYIAAKKAGLKHLPVIYQEFESVKHKKAFITAHNATQQWSKIDLMKVNQEVLDLGPDFDLSWLALKDFVIEPIDKFEPQSNEDDVPEVVHPITRKGDLWLLGNHRLLCGDSTMIDDVERLMNGEKADMVFTDPPYNISFSGSMSNTTLDGKMIKHKGANQQHDIIKNDKMSDEEFSDFMITTMSMIPLFCKGAWYISFGSQTLDDLLAALNANQMKWKSIIIWMKNQATLSAKHYKSRYEPIVYGTFDNEFYGELYKTEDIWEFQRTLKNDLHPTMKPVPLIENAINNSSKQGMKVLDLFLGSGSTLIASEKSGRICRGMEMDEKYCDVIIKRWMAYTGRSDVILESTGESYNDLEKSRV
jgi:DNA modification methylase